MAPDADIVEENEHGMNRTPKISISKMSFRSIYCVI